MNYAYDSSDFFLFFSYGWLSFYPYVSGLIHWHWGNHMIAPVPVKEPWQISANESCESTITDDITTTKQRTTNMGAYSMGYTLWFIHCWLIASDLHSHKKTQSIYFKPVVLHNLTRAVSDCLIRPLQCSKLLPVRQPEADNFGGGPGTFLKLFFNFMFMIWDSRQQDWQLFWLSFEPCPLPASVNALLVNCA